MRRSRSNNCFPQLLECLTTVERACLGAAIVDATGHQAGILVAMSQETDFTSGLHRSIYQAIRRLLGRSVVPLEYASVIAELQQVGVFQDYSNCCVYVSGLGEGINTRYPMIKRIDELKRLVAERNRTKLLEKELDGRR